VFGKSRILKEGADSYAFMVNTSVSTQHLVEMWVKADWSPTLIPNTSSFGFSLFEYRKKSPTPWTSCSICYDYQFQVLYSGNRWYGVFRTDVASTSEVRLFPSCWINLTAFTVGSCIYKWTQASNHRRSRRSLPHCPPSLARPNANQLGVCVAFLSTFYRLNDV